MTSPVGTISATLLLREEPKLVKANETFRYLSPLSMQNSSLHGTSAINAGRARFTSVFSTALEMAMPFQHVTEDPWWNVRIRSYSHSAEIHQYRDLFGWFDAETDGSNVESYASLIGVPIRRNMAGNSTFSITSRVWDMNCSRVERIPQATFTHTSWILRYENYSGCGGYPCSINLAKPRDKRQQHRGKVRVLASSSPIRHKV